MKRVKLKVEIDNGGPIFPVGSVIEVEDSVAAALIGENKAVEVPLNTPCRINADGYDNCMPPDPIQQAAKAAAKGPAPEKP